MKRLLAKLLDFIVPEEKKLSKLLSLEPSVAKKLLPESRLYNKDVTILFDYQNKMVRLLIQTMKFKNNPTVRRFLVQMLYEEYVSLSSDIGLFTGQAVVLIPMPMSKKEKAERGYNQCEELAKEMERIAVQNKQTIDISFDLLSKIRDTKRQVNLTKKDRLHNVRYSMVVVDKKNVLKNHNVIILDDIYTTGSTFTEAKRALLTAGASRVYGLFLAH